MKNVKLNDETIILFTHYYSAICFKMWLYFLNQRHFRTYKNE